MSPIHLRAGDVMTARVITVQPKTQAKDVVALMLANHISGLPVVTAEGELVGIVTESDLLYKETGGGHENGRFFKGLPPFGRTTDTSRKASGRSAADLMTSPVVTVEEDTSLHEIAALMVRRKINRVPVMRAGRLVGIVSRADILRAFTRTDAELAAAVRDSLLHELWVDVSKIRVEVRAGVVRLEGSVDRRSEQELVARWVAAIDGVVSLENHLTFEYDDRDVSLGNRWPLDRV